MKRLVALLTALCLAVTPVAVIAEENNTDVLDNSAELAEVQSNGIPTEAIVNEMKANADALYAEGKYQEAADAYSEVAQKANYLANIMSQCLEPYYSSSSSSLPNGIEIKCNLEALGKKANALKTIRNNCYVYEGVCYSKMGDDETALAILIKALDIVEYFQSDLWTIAAEEIMNIIDYRPDEETIKNIETEKQKQYIGKQYSEFEECFGKANKEKRVELSDGVYYYYDYGTYRVTVNDETGKIKNINYF